jgi:hypothetical protein
MGNKHVYQYEHLRVCIQAKHHKNVKPFLAKELHIEVKTEENNKIVIVLDPRKQFGKQIKFEMFCLFF